MDTTGAGTAIMLAIAALLWFAYLVPTWLRRREYLASERMSAALSRTTPVVEAPEILDEVRRAGPPAGRVEVAPEVLRRRRMRRTRRLASVLMIVATMVVLGQLWLIGTTGMSLGGAVVLIAAVSAGGLAIAVQRRLDLIAMPRTAAPARPRPTVRVPSLGHEAASASWTPRELPKPRYLARTEEPRVVTSQGDLQEALRAASADAERTLRAAQAAPEVVRLRSSPGSSRYAGMGVLGPDAVESADLDEILRRRRTAG